MTTSIETTNTLAISQLKDEIKSLEGQIESSYNESDEIRNTTLPQGASWNISEDDLYDRRCKLNEKIDSLKVFINILSGSEVYPNINDVDLDVSPSIAIELLEDEVKYLNGKINSSYNKSDEISRNDLPSNASWNISEDSLFAEREEYQKNIDALEETVEFLKSIKKSTIDSFKEWFKGSTPKLNEELNIGKEKVKVIFVSYDEFCFINIPW